MPDTPGEFDNFLAVILVVDDEPLVCQMTCSILTEQGYYCYRAENAKQAEKTLKSTPVDLCILDISMPGQNGLDFLKKIRPAFPDLPVIVQSSIDSLEVAGSCLEQGVEDYLIKPVRPERLIISVQNVLERIAWQLNKKYYHQQLELKLQEQEQRLLETQDLLIQQEKLAGIGQMATGVAHEINNPLGYITSNLSVLKKYFDRLERLKDGLTSLATRLNDNDRKFLQQCTRDGKLDLILDDAPDLVAECSDGAEHLKSIVQGLKTFARIEDESPVAMDLEECLENTIAMIWNELKYHSVLKRDYSPCPKILGQQQQLSQVFMNILINAGHAIEADGVITVRTYSDEDTVTVAIQDNGCGIDPDNLEKIFQPFFTTKPSGIGTGLGMSIVQDIIHRYSGTIKVESTPGSGTTFFLTFPSYQTEELAVR